MSKKTLNQRLANVYTQADFLEIVVTEAEKHATTTENLKHFVRLEISKIFGRDRSKSQDAIRRGLELFDAERTQADRLEKERGLEQGVFFQEILKDRAISWMERRKQKLGN